MWLQMINFELRAWIGYSHINTCIFWLVLHIHDNHHVGLRKEWGFSCADTEEQHNGIHPTGHQRHHAKLHRRPHDQQRQRHVGFPAIRHRLRWPYRSGSFTQVFLHSSLLLHHLPHERAVRCFSHASILINLSLRRKTANMSLEYVTRMGNRRSHFLSAGCGGATSRCRCSCGSLGRYPCSYAALCSSFSSIFWILRLTWEAWGWRDWCWRREGVACKS